MHRAILFLVALSAGVYPLRAQDSTVAGRVVDAVTGNPIKGVHIRMLVMPRAPNDEFANVYGAISAADGQFSITGVAPGRYLLQAGKVGLFLVPAKDGQPANLVTVRAHESNTDLRIQMAPRAIVSGHVFNDAGKGMDRAPVSIEPAEPSDIALSMILESLRLDNLVTNDRGEWNVGLPPGKYLFRCQAMGVTAEIRSDGTSPPSFAETFYPSAPARSSAKIVEAIAGRETSGIDIRLIHAELLRVTGIVTGMSAAGSATVDVEDARHATPVSVLAGKDGSFVVAQLPSARYLVSAHAAPGLRSDIVELNLGGRDATGIVLDLRPPSSIAGTLELTGAAGKQIRLEPMLKDVSPFFISGHIVTATVRPDNTFDLAGIAPGRYRLSVQPIGWESYLKTIVLDDVALPDSILDFRRGAPGARLKIITGPAAEISGKVSSSEGAILNQLAVVWLARESEDEPSRGPVGVDGTYHFRGLSPGKYKIIAIDATGRQSADGRSPRQYIEASTNEFELAEGQHLRKDLNVEVVK